MFKCKIVLPAKNILELVNDKSSQIKPKANIRLCDKIYAENNQN